MGFPAVEIGTDTYQTWIQSLQELGCNVQCESPSTDSEGRYDEEIFLVQRSQDWVRILVAKHKQTGERTIFANTIENGCSRTLGQEILTALKV